MLVCWRASHARRAATPHLPRTTPHGATCSAPPTYTTHPPSTKQQRKVPFGLSKAVAQRVSQVPCTEGQVVLRSGCVCVRMRVRVCVAGTQAHTTHHASSCCGENRICWGIIDLKCFVREGSCWGPQPMPTKGTATHRHGPTCFPRPSRCCSGLCPLMSG